MILGAIIGKSTTLHFEFLVKNPTQKFDYVQVMHPQSGFVLCQVVDLVKYEDRTIAQCNVIGYTSKDKIVQTKVPFDPGTEVLKASEEFISETINVKKGEESAYIGKLRGTDIDIFLNLRESLARHISVLAKSGSGKSYCVGVLLEELLEKRIPTLVIDPHGEYHTLKYPADSKEGVEPKSYIKQVQEFGDPELKPGITPLKLNCNLSPEELIHLLPSSLNANQQALLYTVMQGMEAFDFDSLIIALTDEENPAKWALISMIDGLRKRQLFSREPTPFNEIIQPGKCSILNLKGIDPEISQIIVHSLMKDLFEERKRGSVPPFFAVIEEAHNYCPERSFGEVKSSRVLRTIASEGRKFGLGLCIISQRPSRVDKSVLSQCNTQIILKVTNPHDLRAISHSVEGMTAEIEDEIRNLSIGEGILTGVVEMPLFVQIRARRTKHGGTQVNIISYEQPSTAIADAPKAFKEALPVIMPFSSAQDVALMSEKPIFVKTHLVPAVMLECADKESKFCLLVELINGRIVSDAERHVMVDIPDVAGLSPTEKRVLIESRGLREFSPAELMLTSGINLSSATTICESLRRKNFYAFNGKYRHVDSGLLDLALWQINRKIEYRNLDFDLKLEPKQDVGKVKERVGQLVSVTGEKQCYIGWYECVAK